MKDTAPQNGSPALVYRPREVARLLGGFHERTLKRWRASSTGTGPPWIRIGGRILYPKAGLEAFLAERKTD